MKIVSPPGDWENAMDFPASAWNEHVKRLLRFIAKQNNWVYNFDAQSSKVYIGPRKHGQEQPGPAPKPTKPGFLSEHFSEKEFRDGFGKLEFRANLIRVADKLEVLRTKIGKPINITSGYRSPEWNRQVGGVPGSYHTKGLAADIWVDGMSVDALADAARAVGFNGIGRYYWMQFVHVDLRGYGADWTD